MSDNHTQGTIEWYVNWLAERRPDLSDEQRLEMATGFTEQQQPPVRKPDVEEASEPGVIDERAEQRKRERLTGKELRAILAINNEVKQ